MTEPRHAVLEVVEFLTASGRWPAGTAGTVFEADDWRALVEITDDRGHASDFVSLPHDKHRLEAEATASSTRMARAVRPAAKTDRSTSMGKRGLPSPALRAPAGG